MKNKDIEYAIAIYNLGLQEKKVISFNNSLATITSALKNEDYFLFLQSKFIDKSIIISSIEKVFFNIDKEIIALLKLLLRNDDIKKIFSIYKNYQELVDEYFSIKRGIIYTTQKLSSAEIVKLKEAFYNKYHINVIFKNIIDKDLIGGLKIKIDDKIFDYSLAKKIDTIKEKVLIK